MMAVNDQIVVLIRDTAAENRWPDGWATQVTELAIGSALHLPLRVGRQAGGVLSLFQAEPHRFTDDDLAVAHILGTLRSWWRTPGTRQTWSRRSTPASLSVRRWES